MLLAALNEFKELYESEDPEYMDTIRQVTDIVNECRGVEKLRTA